MVCVGIYALTYSHYHPGGMGGEGADNFFLMKSEFHTKVGMSVGADTKGYETGVFMIRRVHKSRDIIREGWSNRWMDERCFRPLLCTVKAELGPAQPGLMRWIWDETLPQSSIDRSTFYSAAHRATKWASGPPRVKGEVWIDYIMEFVTI